MSNVVERLPVEPAASPPSTASIASAEIGRVDIRSAMLTGIFIMLVFYTLYFAAPVLMPIILAMLFNLLLAPVVRLLSKFGIPQALGAALVLLVSLGVLLGGVTLLATPAEEWIKAGPENFQKIEQKLRTLRKPIEQIQKATEQIQQVTTPSDGNQSAQKVELQGPSLTSTLLSGTPEILATTGVVIVLLYFLLASGDSLRRKVVSVIPRLQDKKRAVEIMRGLEHDISHYLLTVTLINSSLGAVATVGLYWMGVPNAMLWGAMVALFNFAPYVGATVSVIILAAVGLLTFDTLGQALLVPGIVATLSVIEGQIITPAVLGQRLSLSPVAIFIAMILWGWLWGVPGALLAVPLLASFKIVCEKLEPLQPVATFLAP
ncbi:MAG: AI-2E family transporter [Candidatus Competibacteraceae bacterium]